MSCHTTGYLAGRLWISLTSWWLGTWKDDQRDAAYFTAAFTTAKLCVSICFHIGHSKDGGFQGGCSFLLGLFAWQFGELFARVAALPGLALRPWVLFMSLLQPCFNCIQLDWNILEHIGTWTCGYLFYFRIIYIYIYVYIYVCVCTYVWSDIYPYFRILLHVGGFFGLP